MRSGCTRGDERFAPMCRRALRHPPWPASVGEDSHVDGFQMGT